MIRTAPYLAGFLALILSLTSVVSGPLRAGSSVGDSVVICTTDGLVQITLGHDGQPVQPHPHCPDCVLADMYLPAAISRKPLLARTATLLSFRPGADPYVFTPAQWRLARAPPALAV